MIGIQQSFLNTNCYTQNYFSNMKILITGGSGQLALSYAQIDRKNILYLASKKDLDITKLSSIKAVVSRLKPDIIFHFASLTRREECAKNKVLARKVNIKGTENIVMVCKKYQIPLLFISSNEVFSGKKNDYYFENDTPDPITTVGKTKFAAEQVVINNLTDYYIVRTSWLYSKYTKNFLQTVMSIGLKDGTVNVVIDEIGSPTYSVDLAKAIKKLITTRKFGIYHFSNTGKVSRYTFAKKAFSYVPYGDKVMVKKITSADFKTIEKAPGCTPLGSIESQKIGVKLRRWSSALKDFLEHNHA